MGQQIDRPHLGRLSRAMAQKVSHQYVSLPSPVLKWTYSVTDERCTLDKVFFEFVGPNSMFSELLRNDEPTDWTLNCVLGTMNKLTEVQ